MAEISRPSSGLVNPDFAADDLVANYKGQFTIISSLKEEIAAALADAVFREGLPLAEKLLAEGATPLDVLLALFLAGAGWAEQNPGLARVTLSHVLRQTFAITQAHERVEGYRSLFALILRLTEMRQEAGLLRRDMSAREMAQILALLHPQTLWSWTMTPEGKPLAKRMAHCLQMCLEVMET